MTAEKLERGVVTRTVGVNAVPMNAMILDVGPETVARIAAALEQSRTLVWNGPVGAFETPPFDRATVAIARRGLTTRQAARLVDQLLAATVIGTILSSGGVRALSVTRIRD